LPLPFRNRPIGQGLDCFVEIGPRQPLVAAAGLELSDEDVYEIENRTGDQ